MKEILNLIEQLKKIKDDDELRDSLFNNLYDNISNLNWENINLQEKIDKLIESNNILLDSVLKVISPKINENKKKTTEEAAKDMSEISEEKKENK